ncbi:MAG TPA: hypothetical protein VNG93_09360 [Candidatus Dormibacteraeota bacterium]|nr:hypothetical protein [Candidatus Dormibacteraeota bacterium]
MRAAPLVLLILLASCSVSQPVAKASPSPPAIVTSQTFVPGPPRPSIWVRAANGHLEAMSWSGGGPVDIGTGPAIDRGFEFIQSPDGSRLLAPGRVVTPAGDLVGVVPAGKIGWTWADDSRHLCADYNPNRTPGNDSQQPATIFEVLPGSTPGSIASAGYEAAQNSATVLACSFGKGTVTAVENCVIVACEVWTFDLASHAQLYHGTASGPAAASRDGAVFAIGTEVRAARDGSPISQMSGAPVGFGFDGVLAAIGSRVVDVRSGRVVWTAPGGAAVTSLLGEPFGSRVAVALGSPGEIWVVGPDGSSSRIAQGVRPLF